MRKRRLWVSFLVLVLVGAAPAAPAAADAVVGGKGPRIRTHAGRPVAAFDRPVFLVFDEFGQFGQLPAREAPPLVIEVKGDVAITPQPDGGLAIRFLDEDE